MKFAFAILLTFVIFNAHCQSISPQTINVSGSNSTANGVTLDYSIGESSSISFYKLSDNSSLSTGVLQSYTPLITGIVDLSFTEGENITVYPNPASQNIRIKGILNHPGFIEFHIVDMGGRVMSLNDKTYYINFFEKEFNVSALNDGVYFIRLMYQSMDNSSKSAVFKFIKIQE
jgi:Secretion system C-terminal sorting domain